MQIEEELLQSGERTSLKLRSLYKSAGYTPYRMSKFEEYDLYADNKDFLVSDRVITFTEPGGKLMALKPDVTLSVIKNSRAAVSDVCRVYYDENVYRPAPGTGSFGEIRQCGVECFGAIGEEELAETLMLAVKSLRALSKESVLAVSCLDILKAAADEMTGVSAAALFCAIEEKNIPALESLCGGSEKTELLKRLLRLNAPVPEAIPALDALFGMADARYNRFRSLLKRLPEEIAAAVTVDFSLAGDVHYYNGIVFRGYIRGIPGTVLSGGQYDTILKKLRPEYALSAKEPHAVGFAVYTDALDTLAAPGQADGFVNVALPKGRLGERVYAMFAKAGFECPSILEQNRKLVFENAEKKVRYFWVKPSDVAIYVERGAADIGVAGKDILLEYRPDVYELGDLKTGICRMAVAAPKGFCYDSTRAPVAATKFPNIARQYFRGRGLDVDIVKLNGSIELAPLLGLSDVIVDIVETGTTLRENNLEVIDTVVPISARLVANKSAYAFKQNLIDTIANKLKEITEDAE